MNQRKRIARAKETLGWARVNPAKDKHQAPTNGAVIKSKARHTVAQLSGNHNNKVSMIGKYHNHTLQTNTRYRVEKPHNTNSHNFPSKYA